jgi:hypothetical protein
MVSDNVSVPLVSIFIINFIRIMKTINIITEENVPVEDLFSGRYSAHKVEGVADTYALVKVDKMRYSTTTELPADSTNYTASSN